MGRPRQGNGRLSAAACSFTLFTAPIYCTIYYLFTIYLLPIYTYLLPISTYLYLFIPAYTYLLPIDSLFTNYLLHVHPI